MSMDIFFNASSVFYLQIGSINNSVNSRSFLLKRKKFDETFSLYEFLGSSHGACNVHPSPIRHFLVLDLNNIFFIIQRGNNDGHRISGLHLNQQTYHVAGHESFIPDGTLLYHTHYSGVHRCGAK
jgi:hypothetical protein